MVPLALNNACMNSTSIAKGDYDKIYPPKAVFNPYIIGAAYGKAVDIKPPSKS